MKVMPTTKDMLMEITLSTSRLALIYYHILYIVFCSSKKPTLLEVDTII